LFTDILLLLHVFDVFFAYVFVCILVTFVACGIVVVRGGRMVLAFLLPFWWSLWVRREVVSGEWSDGAGCWYKRQNQGAKEEKELNLTSGNNDKERKV